MPSLRALMAGPALGVQPRRMALHRLFPGLPLPHGVIPLLAVFLIAPALPAHARQGPLVQVLPNGLTLILEENHSQPIVSASVCVKGGSRTETAEISGLSHYYEHLIYRGGSKEQAPLEFRQKMQQLGEESGGYTTDDYTNYGFTVPRENFDEAFRRLSDAVLDLIVTEERIQSERQVVLEEFNQDDDRPDDRVYRQLLTLVYKVHPYRISPIGERQAIEKAGLETFRTFYEQRYVPSQMVLSIVGDFQSEAMTALVARSWGARPGGRGSFESGLIEPEQAEFRQAEIKMNTSTQKALLGFPTPPAAGADLPALDLSMALLASGKSSRLWQALKIKSDLAISVGGWVDQRLDPGFVAFSLELDPVHLQEALGAVSRELTRLKDQPPTMDELTRVRARLLAQRDRRMETFFARAEALGRSAVMGSAFDVDRYPALIRAVTREDIARVVGAYLRPDQGSLSLVSPQSAAPFDSGKWLQDWRGAWGSGAAGAEPASATAPSRVLLENGTTLIIQRRPSGTVVGAVALLRGGRWGEPAGKSGLANFTAQLLDRGAAGKNQVEIADQLAALGASLDTYGERDDIAARLEVPAAEHRAALELLADILTSPAFSHDEVEKLRQDLLSSIRSLPDRPFENTNRAFYEGLYKQSPYRLPVEGTEASVQAIAEDDIRDFFRLNMVGSNLVLAIVGPVDPETIRSWAERRLGGLSKGTPVKIGGVADKPLPALLDTLVVREQEQTTYNTGWIGPSVTDPDYVPLRLAARVLGDRLFFKYVYQKGVAYRSWFYMTNLMGQGSIQNEMGVSPGVYRDITRELDLDIAHFVREPIPAAELQGAKQKILNQQALEGQTSMGLAANLAFYEATKRGFEGYQKFPELVRAVSVEQASRAAKKYVVPGNFLRVGVGKAEAGKAP